MTKKFNDEEVEEYFKENYNDTRQQTNLSFHKNLWIDYQTFCLKLSKKTKKKITASGRIALLMIRDMLEN